MNGLEWINQWSDSWFSFLLYRSIDMAMVFAIIGLIWLCIHKRVTAQFGYLLFLLVLVKLAVPMQISLPGLFQSYIPMEQTGEISGFGYFGWGLGEGAKTSASTEKPATETKAPIEQKNKSNQFPLSAPMVLLWIWGLGVVFFILRQMWVEWKTCFMFRNTVPLSAGMLSIDLQQLQRQSGIQHTVRWVTGDWVKTPMAYGVFRPAIAVPKQMDDHFSKQQTQWILLHELAHIQRWDALVSMFQNITRIVFFFHPLVWWVNGIIDQQREYACDDAALAWSNAPRKECGEGFLGVAMQANNLPTFVHATLGMVNYKTFIRRRLMRILDQTRSFQQHTSWLSICSLLLIAILIIPLSWKTAFAQAGEWVLVEPSANTPTPVVQNPIAYDTKRNLVFMFGGTAMNLETFGPEVIKDMWMWDGENWTEIPDTVPETDHLLGSWKMVYDEKNDQLMMFGSQDESKKLENTTWIWEYDTKKWQLVSEEGPKARKQHAMAYDSKRGVVILHGGSDDNNTSPQENDTWMWDGESQTWTEISADLPEEDKAESMLNHSMAYDAAHDRIVMFGGVSETGPISGGHENAVWEWNDSKWEKIPYDLDQGPDPIRGDPSLVYNSIRQTVVMYGGVGTNVNDFKDDMWEWDGTSWTEIQTGGENQPHVHFIQMLYLPSQNALFAFGGFKYILPRIPEDISDETWLFNFTQSSVPNWLMFR